MSRTIGDSLWTAHEDPDRPLEYGAVFCDCEVCTNVLVTTGLCQPELPIGVKFGLAQRLVIEAGVLGPDGVSADDLVRRFGEPNDWVREVWVARDLNDCMSPGEAALFQVLSDADIPLPEFNIEVDVETGDWRPAGHRRVRS